MREMTDSEIDTKHIRIRGTLNYKYPPVEAACKSSCGINDDVDKENGRTRNHRCVLAIGHTEAHKWSSECIAMNQATQTI